MTKSRSKSYHYFLGILVVLFIGIPVPKPDFISNFIDGASFLEQDRDFISAPLVAELGEHALFFPEQNVKEVIFYTLPAGFNRTNLFKYPLGSKLQVSEDGLYILEELTGTKTKLDVQQMQAQAVIKNESLGSFVSGINAASESLVLILDSKREVINFFHYLASAGDNSTGQRAAHSLQPILRILDQSVPSYLKTRLDISNTLSAKALALVNTNRKTNEQFTGLSTELATITSLVNSTETSLPDEDRNEIILILELIKTDGQKAISNISGTSDNYNLFMDVLERILGILKQDFVKSKDNVLLESRSEGGSQSRRARSLTAGSASVASNSASSTTERSNLTATSTTTANFTDAQKGMIRRNIFFKGLSKNLHPNEGVVVNLDGEVLYSQTCRINNDYKTKWVRRKTDSYTCAPGDISDITIEYDDEFDFDKALVRHKVDPASPFAFELFKRLISAMRTYYAFSSQNNIYYGQKYYPNTKQSGNYFKPLSSRYDDIFITDEGLFIEHDGWRLEIIEFNTNPYYLFSLLTDANFNSLFFPSTTSSIVASYYQERGDDNITGGHVIFGRGLRNIRPVYFNSLNRLEIAGVEYFDNSYDRSKYIYYYNAPLYQKNIEDFGLIVGSYIGVNPQRKKVSNIKFYIGTRELGQYAPMDPLFGLIDRRMSKNAANFCTVDLQRPAESFSSIVITGVTEILKSGNRIGFTCPNISNGTGIKVIFNSLPNNMGESAFYGYFKLENLPVASGNASGEFVSFDLFKADGYSQAEAQRGEALINGFSCRFVTEAVVHSRLRQSSQALNARFGNQINSGGYCLFKSADLLKMRKIHPAGGQGPAWEGKAVLEDFRRNFTVDKTAPLKKNFATNLGKVSKDGYYGSKYQFPFGPDYWLKTNLGDLVFKGDFIYLYDSVGSKYDPIYVANWQYNNYSDSNSYGDSDAYEILNPILAERSPNFIEAYTATISPYVGPRNPTTNSIERRQSVDFYVAGVNNVKSVSVNVSGTNYVCGDITIRKNSQVHCNFGGLNVSRTCSATQVSYDLNGRDKFLDGKAPTMNSCSLSITTKDNKVVKLPLVEAQSIHRDRVYRQSYGDTRNVYEETLPDKIFYVGTKPPPYLRLSGGYAAFKNTTVTVNGRPCIRPENIALGKIDEVGCYFKSEGHSNEVVATIRIDGENIRTKVVTLESIDLNISGENALRDIGINSFQGNYGNLKYPIQGIKSVKAGTRNCDFPILTLPVIGTLPKMTMPYDAVCYFDIPARASYVPTNNATVLTHEGRSLSLPFTEKGLSTGQMYYSSGTRNDYQESQGKYNKPLIIAQNPLIANTCEQACLSAGYIFDKANYNQAFCSNYASSKVNTSYEGASNAPGGGCQSYYTSNFFNVTEHVNWSNYSPTMPYRPSLRDGDGRVCRCVRY